MEDKNQIKMYALHVTQNNDVKKLMTPDFANYLKSNGVAITPAPSPMFLITLLFKTPEERNKIHNELNKKGIECAVELRTAYVDKKYLKQNDEIHSESESEDKFNA